MSRLTELLRQVRKSDPQLAADLEAEVAALTKRRTFGLVFERHQPEAVELPGRRVRRGDKVRILPARGETKAGDQRLWRVLETKGKGEAEAFVYSLCERVNPYHQDRVGVRRNVAVGIRGR